MTPDELSRILKTPAPLRRRRLDTFDAIVLLLIACGLLFYSCSTTVWASTSTGKATIFARPGDRWMGGNGRCVGRKIMPHDLMIAHRTLPCNARVRVTNVRTGASVDATVGDRGPYGACRPGTSGKACEWFIKRHRREAGTWRGIADLTPAVAEAIGHKSFGRVKIEVLP